MRRSLVVLSVAAALSGCGQSAQNASSSNSPNNAATNVAAAEAPKPAYCFFKDAETKDWAAKLDSGGNLVVSGKAYREDSRYKAVLAPATINGETAEVAPTIAQNDTGFAAPGNWWDVSETIPNSAPVTSVLVKCGDKTLAKLTVSRKK